MFKLGDRVQSTDRDTVRRRGFGTVMCFSKDGSKFRVEYGTKITQRTYDFDWYKTDTKKLKLVGS